MTRAEKTRRLPSAVLGALLAVVVASALPAATSAPVGIGKSPVAVGSGHVTDALLAGAHPRPVTHLPASLPVSSPYGATRPAPPTAVSTFPSFNAAAASPPTAIRGPPA